MTLTYLIVAVVLILLGLAVVIYNGLVAKRNRTNEAWADIDVQLKRRYDLIPNLVETVKGYAAHESQAFEKVSQARAAAMGAATGSASLADRGAAESTLAGALKSVFAIAEAYPELKANQNFLALQTELTDTEDKIQAARRFYNGNVRDLNIAIQSFPGNIFAGVFGFKPMDYFELAEADAAAREPVAVKF